MDDDWSVHVDPQPSTAWEDMLTAAMEHADRAFAWACAEGNDEDRERIRHLFQRAD